MNVLSLFDGLSCGQIALNRLGVRDYTYYASEIDKYAIQVTQHNYPNTIQLGNVEDWRNWDIDWSKIDLVTSGFPCFRKRTLVNTREGLKEIQDIKKGDLVLTHKNRYKKVVNTFLNSPNVFYKLKTVGTTELETTSEHPFFVKKRFYVYQGRKKISKFSEASFIELKNLTSQHYIGMPILKTSEFPKWKGINSKTNATYYTHKNEIKTLFSNLHFWYFVGRYFGDGWVRIAKRKGRINSRTYNTIICCAHDEKQELINIFDKLPFKYCISKERTTYKFNISSEELAKFLRRYGHLALNKHLGDLVHLPKPYLSALVDGYLSADGHKVNANEYKANSISKRLITDLQMAWLKIYKQLPTISYIRRPSTCIIEGRIVNQKSYYTILLKKTKHRQIGILIEDDFIWSRITTISTTNTIEETYNFEVEDDNSYCVNNLISHNCQSWSMSGNRWAIKTQGGNCFGQC